MGSKRDSIPTNCPICGEKRVYAFRDAGDCVWCPVCDAVDTFADIQGDWPDNVWFTHTSGTYKYKEIPTLDLRKEK